VLSGDQKLEWEPNSPGGRIVRRVLEEQFGYNFDPLIELIKLAQRTQSDAVAAKCYADACKYCYPQLKSIEVKSNVLHAVAMPDMELANRFRQYMDSTDKKPPIEQKINNNSK